MAGTTGDIKGFDDVSLGNVNESSKVQAVVDWFGPIEFNQMDPRNLGPVARAGPIMMKPTRQNQSWSVNKLQTRLS